MVRGAAVARAPGDGLGTGSGPGLGPAELATIDGWNFWNLLNEKSRVCIKSIQKVDPLMPLEIPPSVTRQKILENPQQLLCHPPLQVCVDNKVCQIF